MATLVGLSLHLQQIRLLQRLLGLLVQPLGPPGQVCGRVVLGMSLASSSSSRGSGSAVIVAGMVTAAAAAALL
jgi:hypothetical protein